MNIVTPFQNHGWAAAGAIGGIIAGAAANLWKSGSLFENDLRTCRNPFNGFDPFILINNFRESDLKFINHNPLAPTPFNWIYPTVHIVPMLGYSIWNIYKQKTDEKGSQSFAERGWSQISKNVMYPALHTTLLTIPSLIIRALFLSRTMTIDVSGHAIVQGALTIHAINSLQAIAETGTSNQKKLHSIICAIVALSDAIWMYNTTASCHSVADVACGIVNVSLVHFGIQASKALINKGFNLAKAKYQELTISTTNKLDANPSV